MPDCAHCGISTTKEIECKICNCWKCHEKCYCTKRGDYVFIIERHNGSVLDVWSTQQRAALRLAECAKIMPGFVEWVNRGVGSIIMEAEAGRFSAVCYRVCD